MRFRHLAAALTGIALVATLGGPASATPLGKGVKTGIQSIAAITEVDSFGQKVKAVAVEYRADVNPRKLDRTTFTVSDSIYNFRFNEPEDLAKRADRTITRIYTNDRPALHPRGTSQRGRFVIVELSMADPGGNTVIRSTCSGRCYEKVNPDLPTQVIQNADVHAQPGKGKGNGPVLAKGGPTRHPLTGDTINLLVDEFQHGTFTHDGTDLPYAYHLPRNYNPRKQYPVVVALHGWGSGFDGENRGVQLAVDIMVTAWLRPERTGSREDVIVLAPQNPRIGTVAESAAMVALLRSFLNQHRGADRDRVYVSTFSWGSTLAYDAMSRHPGLFAGALINGGFQVTPAQAAQIATARTPFWITHATSDPVLPVANSYTSTQRLRDAYVAAGVSPAKVQNLIRYSEYADDAFAQPDYHAVTGPVYEDPKIPGWLLKQ